LPGPEPPTYSIFPPISWEFAPIILNPFSVPVATKREYQSNKNTGG